jgi:hypothetical protein
MNMKTKLIRVLSVFAVGCLALIFADSALAQMKGGNDYGKQPSGTATSSGAAQASKTTGTEGAKMATPITKAEAEKKYPPPKSGQYPLGERDPHKSTGLVNSPYPPHTEYDCSNIAHGGLALDPRVNKVFVRP